MKPLTEEDRKATYLGDGAYILDIGYGVEIFTSDGISKQNIIVLEDTMIDTLIKFKEDKRK